MIDVNHATAVAAEPSTLVEERAASSPPSPSVDIQTPPLGDSWREMTK